MREVRVRFRDCKFSEFHPDSTLRGGLLHAAYLDCVCDGVPRSFLVADSDAEGDASVDLFADPGEMVYDLLDELFGFDTVIEYEGGEGMAKMVMQVLLKVNDGGLPEVVAAPVERESHPANEVPLTGATVELPDRGAYTEEDGWAVAARVSELCALGRQKERDANDSVRAQLLSGAYTILGDLVENIEDLERVTCETLIREAMGRLKKYGQVAGCYDIDGGSRG